MPHTDYIAAVPQVDSENKAAKFQRLQQEKEMRKQASEAAAASVAEGLLTEAMLRGYAVNTETEEALKAKGQPVAEEKPPEPDVDPVDQILENLEMTTKTEVPEAMAEPDDDEDDAVAAPPDFEAEAERQLLDEEIARAEEGYGDDEEEAPFNSEDRRRAIIAEKKAAWYEKQAAERGRKQWIAEAKKHYPYSTYALDKIGATSRRGFLKEAKAAHEAVKPYIKSVVSEREAQILAEREKMREEERQKAEDSWGKPLAHAGADRGPSERIQGQIAKARREGDLAKVIFLQNQLGEVNEDGAA